jgi:hypothetical protein
LYALSRDSQPYVSEVVWDCGRCWSGCSKLFKILQELRIIMYIVTVMCVLLVKQTLLLIWNLSCIFLIVFLKPRNLLLRYLLPVFFNIILTHSSLYTSRCVFFFVLNILFWTISVISARRW